MLLLKEFETSWDVKIRDRGIASFSRLSHSNDLRAQKLNRLQSEQW